MDRSCARLGLLLALAFSAAAAAAPPDQPPLAIPVITANFNYVVRSGGMAPHLVPESRLRLYARALDRGGTAQNGNPQGYHPGYTGSGFSTPYFSGGSNDVVFWACGDNPGGFDCDNGFATLDQIIMPTDVYGNASESCVRGILGHELFHHIEYRYTLDGGGGDAGCGNVFGSTACEGQARALQDKVYWDLDLNPAASCVATFRSQVDGYLAAPDLTIWNASYGAALFWTYLMEQYGEFAFEPGRGVDFLTDWWDFAQDSVADPSIYQITEDAIRLDHPDHSVLGAYHDFIIANLVKDLDLSNETDAFRLRYSYRDEEPVFGMNNLMQFQPVAMPADLVVPDGGSRNSNVSAKRFGAEYRRFDVRACPAGRVLEFSAIASAQAAAIGPSQQVIVPDGLFALVPVRETVEPGQPAGLYKYRAKSWKQTILQPATPYTHVLAVTSGWHTDFGGTLTMRCKAAPPPATIALISSAHPAISGTPGEGSIGEVTVSVADSQSPFSPIDTLGQPAFGVRIGLLLPAVQKVREAAGRHRLIFPFPELPLGSANAQVTVGAASTSISNGVRVAAHQPEILIALDTSASMGLPSGATKLDAAKRALRALLVSLPRDARVGLLTYAGNSTVANDNVSVRVALGVLDPAQRAALSSQLAAVVPSTGLRVKLTDVLVSSIGQFDTQGNSGERHLLLLTDSGDAGADAAALATQARNAGIRAHAIALDDTADQPLHARVAAETGGTFALVNVPDEPSALLLPAVQAAREAASRLTSAATAHATATAGSPAILPLAIASEVDAGSTGSGHVKVFSGRSGADFAAVRLFRPDGSVVLAGPDADIFTAGDAFAFHLRNAPAGEWRLEVDASSAGGPALQVTAYAEVQDAGRGLRMAFATPAGDPVALDQFRVGDPILVQVAVVDFVGAPAPVASVTTSITRAADTLTLALNDTGQGGDEQAGDQVYSGIFRRADAGSPTGLDENGSATGQHGSYRVEARVDFGSRAAPEVLTQTRHFAVLQDPTVPDSDGDGLPDRHEARHACLVSSVADAGADADGDAASTALEYASGTDPCDVDSDDGGETDGSEIARLAGPLDAADDGARRIRHVEILTARAEHEESAALPAFAHTLRYDSDPGYTQVIVKRAPAANGPFIDHALLDAAASTGRYVDSALSDGQHACYQLVARGASGAVSAASDTVCATARADNTAPRGSVVLDDGAPRTTSGLLNARLAIDGEPATGMQMELRYPDGTRSGWIAYAPFVLVDAQASVAPAALTVAVVFRDASGNESSVYADDIDRVAAASVGALVGRVRAQADGLAIAGASLSLDADNEPGASSLSHGGFSLDALPPGSYTLVVEHPDFAALTKANVFVSAGAVTDLGDLLLGTASLFRDGFEAAD